MRRISFVGAYTIAGLCVFIALLMLLYPKQGFDASLKGVLLWWDVLLPALLPFFVISELLLGFGIVHFFGTLLDPLMRPLFRIPGIGGFVVAMGFASGYPVGARLTSQLWEQRLVTREEGERLVAFTTSSDPIFLIGAVSIGFFNDASLAGILGAAHYGSALIVGLLMRYHGQSSWNEAQRLLKTEVEQRRTLHAKKRTEFAVRKRSIFLNAFEVMHKARIDDGRKVGEVLSYAIQRSLSLIMVVGGLVVFFSVILAVLNAAGMIRVLFYIVSLPLGLLHVPPELIDAVLRGFFEVTLGAQAAGQAGNAIPLFGKVAVAAFVLSWGGLSVHAQIISLMSQTPMRYGPFVTARIVHATLSAVFVLILWRPLESLRHTKTAFNGIQPGSSGRMGISALEQGFTASVLIFIGTIISLCVLGIVYKVWRVFKS
jgi:sporulation integral membrane protein YlbJ